MCSIYFCVCIPYLSLYRVNEVLFAVSSNDPLFSLSSDEVSQNIEGNRLARLAGHLLHQQSFAPQFPAPQSMLAQVRLMRCAALCCVRAPNVEVYCPLH
jgi:hypothetical protein